MANNQPIQLKVVSAGRVSQYNKQKIQAIHPNGTQFEVSLGDKSPKVAEGQMDASHMFEIWQYTPPGKSPMWCGKLVQPAQQSGPQQPPQVPQQAPQRPTQGQTPPPNNKDRLIVAQVVYKVLAGQDWPGALGEFDVWLMGNENVFERHVALIMRVGRSFEQAYNIPSEGQGEPL